MRYRGSTIALFAPTKNVWDVLDLNANVVRYPIIDPNPDIPVGELGAEEYKAWVRTHLNHIDTFFMDALCQCRGQLILTIHTPPGGRTTGAEPKFRMFTDRQWAKTTFKEIWVEIAHRYLGNNKVLCYDLLNEPGGTAHQVNTLMRNTVKAVRTIDRVKPIAVTCPYGDPSRVDDWEPVKAVNIWYTVHMYSPITVTHQGVYPQFPAPKLYPGPNTGRTRMQRDFAKFRSFCNKHALQGYVGEFSISTFADEASRVAYLSDVQHFVEAYGWHATYHSWREASVWNAEGSQALDVLKEWWRKND